MSNSKHHGLRQFFGAAALLVLAGNPITAIASTTFHLHREGTDADASQATFVAGLGRHRVTDFEDPALGMLGQLPSLTAGHVTLDLTGYFNGPYTPTIETSTLFNVPGKINGMALTCGSQLTLTTPPNRPARAIGMWIYDDTRAFDSVYLVQVTETNGALWQAVLANDTPLNSHGHEIEGFVAAVSDVGIAMMRVIAVHPVSLQPQPDLFEIDHLLTAAPFAPTAVNCLTHDDGPEPRDRERSQDRHRSCGGERGAGPYRDDCLAGSRNGGDGNRSPGRAEDEGYPPGRAACGDLLPQSRSRR